jgi:hypothetical protein
MICFTLVLVFRKGARRWIFGNDVQKQRTPSHHHLVVPKRNRKFVLDRSDSKSWQRNKQAYKYGMLVGFEYSPQHLSRLNACLIHQAIADIKKLGKSRSHDLIEVFPTIASFKPVDATDGEQTLHSGKNGVGVIGLEQLDRDVDEFGPLAGKVMLQDLAQRGNKLRANRGRRAG